MPGALSAVDLDHAALYYDVVLTALPQAARAVLAILDARGVSVSDDVRARIAACTDLDQLDTWVRRAVTATTSQDLFA